MLPSAVNCFAVPDTPVFLLRLQHDNPPVHLMMASSMYLSELWKPVSFPGLHLYSAAFFLLLEMGLVLSISRLVQ